MHDSENFRRFTSAPDQGGAYEAFSRNKYFVSRECRELRRVPLVLKGTVRLRIEGMPKLNRIFGKGSLLGLPSTFTGKPYSLTTTAITQAHVVQVAQENLLRLMLQRPELWREATETLGREISFIEASLAERRNQIGSCQPALVGQSPVSSSEKFHYKRGSLAG